LPDQQPFFRQAGLKVIMAMPGFKACEMLPLSAATCNLNMIEIEQCGPH
jgi:hypothetical protein